ncbi:MAG: hypothetical protein AAFW60_00940 [Pseudomonadota bacterium]
MTANKPRRFRKFVALDEHGNVHWGTLANTKEEAEGRFIGHNPDPVGGTFNPSYHELEVLEASIMEVTIKLKT